MLKEANFKILEDISQLIGQLKNEEYSQNLAILHYKSIGDHIRHIIEFYDCLFANNSKGLNYDSRLRDEQIATDKEFAKEKCKRIKEKILALDLQQSIDLHQTIEGQSFSILSNFQRELLYNLEHAIHHLAIIKIAIFSDFPNVELENRFGVAFSTLAHEQNKN